jgi:hypothetical protein
MSGISKRLEQAALQAPRHRKRAERGKFDFAGTFIFAGAFI